MPRRNRNANPDPGPGARCWLCQPGATGQMCPTHASRVARDAEREARDGYGTPRYQEQEDSR